MRNAIAAVMACAVFAAPVVAASFECAKASASIERMICTNPQLSKLDEELSSSYKVAMAKAVNEEQLKTSQRWWLAQIRNSCTTVDCMMKVYTQRLTALNKQDDISFVPPPASSALTAKEADACLAVVNASNHGQLHRYEQRAPDQQPSRDQLRKIFGPDAELSGSDAYWSIDLDDDGILDHFAITTQGTAGITNAIGRLSRKGSVPTVIDASGKFASDHNLLNINGSYYLLTSTDGPDELWKWRKNGELEGLCVFPRLAPEITLSPSSTHPVCNAMMQGKTQSVAFTAEHSIGPLNDNRFRPGMQVRDGMARIDLNNDGTVDSVVQVEISHGAGRGCDTIYLATTDSKHTTIPDTPLNKLLREELGGWACGPRMSALSFDGQSFVEMYTRVGNRIVYQITGTKAAPICIWHNQTMSNLRLLNSVINP
jgi:uncharacterized protein